MWNEKEIFHYLQLNLSESRLKHSLGVSETAVTLAVKYGENIESARIAGLVHDCAKNMKAHQLMKMASEHKIHIDEIYTNNPSILHGVVGSLIAREVMEIQDDDILKAIRYHTTGRKNMSILEKIIYISDYIEPLRKFEGVEALRTLSYINLDAAVIQSLENTIIYVISQKELLHIDTIDARNYLLSKNRRCEDE
ncbi:bis(5'-nucleosyl)-tetraphosphatase (symmetrical) YqeK [Clostridium estertheticum]|uniref:bis(5'-nucleosyl)-tetraphosphatase (symmetrical) YqeK n=1 Tax=Clostridium estertheticum TaxID=238834 RepID=UPI0013E90D90|nr:bis(5'-nucleosyl)-tetraphosphatase (symmetrical) YqeK [Clostridium estertheticum]MBZ9688224.1 bis(5'-nucleosyl)-tetraphosphatase (symmetrical) YqeK [Clostridium estertheticum]